MKENWRGEAERINPIYDPAMSFNHGSEIFYIGIAFVCAHHEATGGAEQSDQELYTGGAEQSDQELYTGGAEQSDQELYTGGCQRVEGRSA